MINYCRNCGANLEPGATRCRRCGIDISEMPEEEPSFGEKLKSRLSHGHLLRNSLLVLAAFLVLLSAVCIASALSSRSSGSTQDDGAVVLPSPSPSSEASPEATEAPKVNWAEIYKSFLETEPSVNSAMIQDAADYGFEGIVTAELFALADVNGDDIPELLLATRPETLPGWNVTSEQGYGVESYIVCGVKEGRISPLMCVKSDYSFYPLTISVNDSWILELSQGSSAKRSMLFRSPQSQSSSLSLKYEFSVEQRCNSKGVVFDAPAEYYSINGSSVTGSEFMEQLFPEGSGSLSYFPIYFKELSPGCLDELESDWENREVHQLSREDFSRLWSIAGSGQISREAEDILPYIGEARCINVTSEEQSSVIEIVIDKAQGWDYVSSLEISSVSVEGADAWIHSAVSQDLEEGLAYEYVVGLSFIDEPSTDYTVCTQITLSLYDGSQISKTLYTQAAAVQPTEAPADEAVPAE